MEYLSNSDSRFSRIHVDYGESKMSEVTIMFKGKIGDEVYYKDSLHKGYIRGFKYEVKEQLPSNICYWVSQTPTSGSVYVSESYLLSKEEYKELLERKLKEVNE